MYVGPEKGPWSSTIKTSCGKVPRVHTNKVLFVCFSFRKICTLSLILNLNRCGTSRRDRKPVVTYIQIFVGRLCTKKLLMKYRRCAVVVVLRKNRLVVLCHTSFRARPSSFKKNQIMFHETSRVDWFTSKSYVRSFYGWSSKKNWN